MTRVLISGIGLLTPLGQGVSQTWDALLGGHCAVGPIKGFDASSLRTQVGAEIPDFDATPYVDRRSLSKMTRNDLLAVVAAALAVSDSGVVFDDPDSAGLFLAGGKEISDPTKVLDAVLTARNNDGSVDIGRMGSEGARLFYPLFYVEGLQAAALFYISQAHGLRGANTYFAGGSDAGATAIGRAYRAVARGEASVAIAGGFDEATSWWNMTKFDALGTLTERNDLGSGACRPYSCDRDGSVLGEGAAFLVLEDAEAVARRGAAGYAELAGYGFGFDGGGLVTPSPSGAAMASAITAALAQADIGGDAVDCVITEGCGTVDGDRSEAAALRSALGAPAAAAAAASSLKSATGHLLAGSGPLNVAVAALAIREGKIPPTANLTHPDPECEGIGWVTGSARTRPVRHALALAQGLEGQNVALLLRAPDGIR